MNIDKEIDIVLNEPTCSKIVLAYSSISETDLYRMVACVEESNAEFEGFAVRDWEGRPETLLGYPVVYSDVVPSGVMVGGMWSNFKNGKLQHGAAFVVVSEIGFPCYKAL